MYDAVAREIKEHPFGAPTFTGRSWPLGDVRLLAPILATKVVCMGKNYVEHIKEMGGDHPDLIEDPIIFLKPNTSIIGPGVPIQLPANASPVHHEGELAAVIGRPCKDVPAARARQNVILGYTIANDVSARDQQKADGAVGPAPKATTHSVRSARGSSPTWTPPIWRSAPRSMGQVRQRSRTSPMIHDVGAIIEWMSSVMTLAARRSHPHRHSSRGWSCSRTATRQRHRRGHRHA